MTQRERASERSRWQGARDGGTAAASLGAALQRAWVGYQERLDAELAAAGFDDRGFPDGRVLRMCSGSAEMTISEIGRQLGISRQGAAKVVDKLRDRRYVTVRASTTSAREKTVKPTQRAVDYLAAQRTAARGIERKLRRELGDEALDALERLLDALGGHEETRLRDCLTRKSSV